MAKTKKSVYDIVTEKIIKALENEVIPWQKPANRIPDNNLTTKDKYHGVNVLLTGYNEFNSPYWVTFNQAKKLGGHVNKGERSTPIFYWGMGENTVEDENGNPIVDSSGNVKKEKYFFPRFYTVFNIEQCTLPEKALPEVTEREDMKTAESIVEQFTDCPDIQEGNFDFSEFTYLDGLDSIRIPSVECFTSEEEYYATLFKGLVYSTRNKSRLNRKEKKETFEAKFGFEELVAEIGSSFLCYEAGITKVIPNQTAYIQNWLGALKESKTMVVYAAGAAKKAVDYILRNYKNETEKNINEEEKENVYDVL